MWAFGAGYLNDPTNSVSTDPSYDPYSGGASNYVSTDPTYSPYGQSSGGSMWSSPSLWGSVFKGIGGYAQSASDADAAKEQAKLSAKAQKELLEQQRGYALQDRQTKSDSVGKWDKYFGS